MLQEDTQWREQLLHHILPRIERKAVIALRDELRAGGDRLLQKKTVGTYRLDEAFTCCPLAFLVWQSDPSQQPMDVFARFKTLYKGDDVLFIRWWDYHRKDVTVPLLLKAVELFLAGLPT